MKKVFPIVLVAVIICSSCKKAAVNNGCANTMADIAATYSITKVEDDFAGFYQNVTNGFLKSCQLDDKIILNSNGTSSYSDIGVKCNPDGSVSGTWSSSADGKISISGGALNILNAEIVSFDCKTLVLKFITTYNVTPSNGRVTLVK